MQKRIAVDAVLSNLREQFLRDKSPKTFECPLCGKTGNAFIDKVGFMRASCPLKCFHSFSS